jgi:Tfp pilus assembly protein PilN
MSTNLLPSEYRRRVRLEYRLRLVAVVGTFVCFFVFVSGILLLPSYFLSRVRLEAVSREYNEWINTGESKEYDNLDAMVQMVNKDITTALEYAEKYFSASGAFQQIVEIQPQSMRISELSYQGEQEGNHDITLRGIAETRDALLAFRDDLRMIPKVLDASVPLSDLVRTGDIPFTITIRFRVTSL